MKRIYIAGCGGMLGDAFYKVFSANYKLKCTDIDVNEPWLSYLDFRDHGAYRKDVMEFKPDYLFHLGAYTDLEYCELHPADTYATNTLSVENAAYIANELNIPLLYISTAGIFDGRKDVYDDWDQPNPLGHYARSKYAGEIFVKENIRQHLVCRAGWMMGGGPRKDKKFIQKIMRQIKEGKTELFVVNDKLGAADKIQEIPRQLLEPWLVFKKFIGDAVNGQCTRIALALRVDVLVPRTIGHPAIEYFYAADLDDTIAQPRIEARSLGVKDYLPHARPVSLCSTPRLASASARSLPSCPACPRTQCQLTLCRAAAVSSCCHKSTFLTGCRSAVRHPRRFQLFTHSVMPFCTYCESV